MLNAADHGGLRLRRRDSTATHFVQIVTGEFAAAATACPILLTKKAATGAFFAGAMFGFRPGENLLGATTGGRDVFWPLDLERQAFYIAGDGIAIDRHHPRIDEADGDPLFDEEGQPSPRLRRIQRILGQLKSGLEETDRFIATLLAHRLVEPIDIGMRFDDGERIELNGLYTVSLDALHELDDATALALFRNGYLQLAYCMAGSLKQIPLLAERRNARLAHGA
ncbi:SapC family protein [Sphingomonas quercus]|uniref:SapC family protein n=1 Tax=Sphingomonas quercus TaxID=2842451 RepID=A0ABS6BGX4_9SPHN|nr:SapC family protein [Sphingomonas quercus]MBU3077550.1 SapC family protein [Sphingomonas quercus]